MDYIQNIDPWVVNYFLLPLLIFVSRVSDVTIGTLRIAFLSRGDKITAPLLGFLEVLILIIAIGQVMKNLDNFTSYFAWAAGFAIGNFVGMRIEEKLALGQRMVRIITAKPAIALVEHLNDEGYPITHIDAAGSRGQVNILFTIIKRKDLQKVINIIEEHHPKAFYTVEDVSMVSKNQIVKPKKRIKLPYLIRNFHLRKAS